MDGFAVKTVFRIFVIIPILALSSCIASGYVMGGGSFNVPAAVIASIAVVIVYMFWVGKGDDDKFRQRVIAAGINPEYLTNYGDNGIAIDKTGGKVFAGSIKNGKILAFDEITSIEAEDYPRGRHMKYMLHLNTKDFEAPRVTVGFAGHRGPREAAYSKLRAALGIG